MMYRRTMGTCVLTDSGRMMMDHPPGIVLHGSAFCPVDIFGPFRVFCTPIMMFALLNLNDS